MSDTAAAAVLAPCSAAFMRNSRALFYMSSEAEPAEVEALVRQITALSGQQCDWHYMGGRAIVRTSGARDRAKSAAGRCVRSFERMLAERGHALQIVWMPSRDL